MANTVQTRSSDDPIIQWVTFRLAGETYGINVMQVQEVLRFSDIAPVPGLAVDAAAYSAGVAHGQVAFLPTLRALRHHVLSARRG